MLTSAHIGYSYYRGGYIALLYTPLESVESYFFAQTVGHFVGKITFPDTAARHLAFPNLKVAERGYSINTRETKNGTLYEVTISGLLKDVTPRVLSELEDMTDRSFVLVLETADKTKFLVGTPETPAQFTYNIEGRNAANDLSRIRFQFKSRLAHPITAISI